MFSRHTAFNVFDILNSRNIKVEDKCITSTFFACAQFRPARRSQFWAISLRRRPNNNYRNDASSVFPAPLPRR
jgi:hypothetical protein